MVSLNTLTDLIKTVAEDDRPKDQRMKLSRFDPGRRSAKIPEAASPTLMARKSNVAHHECRHDRRAEGPKSMPP